MDVLKPVMDKLLKVLLVSYIFLSVGQCLLVPSPLPQLQVNSNMKCTYGARGSLTATCVNVTASFFKHTSYRFDNLDVTVKCLNCSLYTLEEGTFDITGNQIETLDLTRSRISIIKTKAFIGLMYMKNLLMSHNYVRSIYPGTFQGIKNIEYLDLENNSIALLDDDAFKELVNLRTLNLKSNVVTTIRANAFNGLENLMELFLENNQIGGINKSFGINLPKLYTLNLDTNRIKSIGSEDLKNLSSIYRLNLGSNLLLSIPLFTFSALKNLEYLNLNYNPINSILPGSFDGLGQLETLLIEDAMLREIPTKTWQGLHRLKSLNLAFNRLFEFQTGMYSGLPKLINLNVSHNEIESIERTGVFSLSLHILDLSYNNISKFDCEELVKHMPKLSFISFEHNPLTCETMKKAERYFEEDNILLVLHTDDTCENATYLVPVPKASSQKEEVQLVQYDHNYAVIYGLLFFILVLIGLLFYAQYRVYKQFHLFGRERFESTANLVSSSDLQSRDIDCLRD